MSQQAFPEQVDIRRFFSQEGVYQASIPLQRFPRLVEYLSPEKDREGENSDAKILVDLKFSRDQEGHSFITGSISGEVKLNCQRCLQSIPFRLDTELSVQVLEKLNEDGNRELVEDEMDVVLTQDGRLDLLSMIEDEVILSLPIVVYHDSEDCSPELNDLKKAELDDAGGESPFARLESLKQQLGQEKRTKK